MQAPLSCMLSAAAQRHICSLQQLNMAYTLDRFWHTRIHAFECIVIRADASKVGHADASGVARVLDSSNE